MLSGPCQLFSECGNNIPFIGSFEDKSQENGILVGTIATYGKKARTVIVKIYTTAIKAFF